MAIDGKHFHIQFCDPNDVWPRGGWSLYEINGDEIANRVVWERVNVERGHYEGGIFARHSWCGYVGMFVTIEEVAAEITRIRENAAKGKDNVGRPPRHLQSVKEAS